MRLILEHLVWSMDAPFVKAIEGDPSARGLGYVDISSVSGYPQYVMELMST